MISVVVPVYDGEKYLARCLDSVFAQTARDYEVLLLDDGSRDGSLALMRQIEAARPGVVRVFSHPNKGVANTRNEGIERAAGKYVMFLDQDDTLDPDCMETFLDAAERADADVVIGGYRRPDADGRVRVVVRPTDEAYIRYKHLQAWAKIHRTDFLRENGICFFANSIGEDIPFTLRENALARRSVVIDYIGYNWTINEQSVSYTMQTGLERNAAGIRLLLEEIQKTRTDDALYEYIVVKTVIYLLLACGRVDAPDVFVRHYRELFLWLGEAVPGYPKNRYIVRGPRGQERRISMQVCLFLTLHRLGLIGLFARAYCRGKHDG
ncbi:MAG: glycosyltransferase [Clostridiales Family XIII bacterium]|jgi:glycosyltransferase involved in cell wall biosynthesis|nr:glycosyltransferase [Clostridiales Family XIII bacterium]